MSAGDGSGHRLGVETSSGDAGPLAQHDESGWEARELQPMGLTEDGSFLLLMAADDRGTHFRVRADDRLRGLTRGATGRPNPYQPRADSALTPREIQARLRAGQTASEVARAAGVPVERIQRYETPVLAERGRVVEQAQAARPPVRAEEPRRPLGEIVAERLGQRGIPEDEVHWDASRRFDGAWTIQMTFPRDATTVTACWLWDPAVGRVRPHDDEAAALLEPLTTGPAFTAPSDLRHASGPVPVGLPAPATTYAPVPVIAGTQPASTTPWPVAPAATSAPAATHAASNTPAAAHTPGANPTAAAAPNTAASSTSAAAPVPTTSPSPAASFTPAASPAPLSTASPTASPTGAAASAASPAERVSIGSAEPAPIASAGPVTPVTAPEAAEPPTDPASAATATPAVPEAVPLTLVPNALDPDDYGDDHDAHGGLRADRRTGGDAPGPAEEVPRKATPPRGPSRRGRREVPAWDDIVFGAKGG